MKSLELTKPITTESLLAEFESRFNQTLDLSKYTKEELEDTANHIRTKIHNITQNTHFGQELKNENYQKSQMMLDIVNQAINEYGSLNTDAETGKMVDKVKKASGMTDKEKKEILEYNLSDVEVNEKLFLAILDKAEKEKVDYKTYITQAIFHGRSKALEAKIKQNGIPINLKLHSDLETYYPEMRKAEMEELNKKLGIRSLGTFL